MKFRKGDLVIGISVPYASYAVTGSGSINLVYESKEAEDKMGVECLVSQGVRVKPGLTYNVRKKYFRSLSKNEVILYRLKYKL